MSVVTEKLIRDRFRERYQDEKPNWELIDGIAEQKAFPTKRHARLEGILARMLEELGFRSYTELTLAISETWEPIPDVAGTLSPESAEAYQTKPPAAVIEILSPTDRFTQLDKKCRRYAQWGVPDILVFDPNECRAWYWSTSTDGLMRVAEPGYPFASKPGAGLRLAEAFRSEP